MWRNAKDGTLKLQGYQSLAHCKIVSCFISMCMTPDLCFDFKKKKRLLICVLVAVLQEYKLILLIVRELSLK